MDSRWFCSDGSYCDPDDACGGDGTGCLSTDNPSQCPDGSGCPDGFVCDAFNQCQLSDTGDHPFTASGQHADPFSATGEDNSYNPAAGANVRAAPELDLRQQLRDRLSAYGLGGTGDAPAGPCIVHGQECIPLDEYELLSEEALPAPGQDREIEGSVDWNAMTVGSDPWSTVTESAALEALRNECAYHGGFLQKDLVQGWETGPRYVCSVTLDDPETEARIQKLIRELE